MHEITNFIGGTIIAGDEMQDNEGAALVVQGERILRIGEPVPEARMVDMSGKLLCPMFVNAHTHIGDTGAKELGNGRPMVELVNPPHGLKHRFLNALDEDTLVEMMRHAMQEMLRNGIIAIGDFREQGLKGVKAFRRAQKDLPLRGIVLGRMDETASPEQVDSEARAILEIADGIGIRDVTSYDLKVIAHLRADFPHKLIAAHASENLEAEQKSVALTGHGQTARHLDWGPNFLVHLVHAPEGDLKRMAQLGIPAVSCPRTNGSVGDGLPDLALWDHLALSFALGTDNMMFNAPNMLREMDYASRMVRGLKRDTTIVETSTILKAATIVGARALKLDNDLGSLEAGKEASFIAFDLNSPNLTYQHNALSAIVHRATTSDIHCIYIKGRQLEEYLL